MPIYLDNNATTQPLPEVIEAVAGALREHWPNPSSVHRAGQSVRRAVDLARRSVAGLVGAKPRDVVFTSGATESIDLALRGLLDSPPGTAPERALITTAIEHEAVRDVAGELATRHAVRHRTLALDAIGRVDLDDLRAALAEPGAALVSVQWANNETGVIQPVREIGLACRAASVPFHCDATQWVGKMPTVIDWGARQGFGANQSAGDAVPVDLLSCSAHKFHGPKGVGALVVRRGLGFRPMLLGTQELGRRGGTENVPGIVGMGAAAEAAAAWLADHAERDQLAAARDRFEQAVLERVQDAAVNPPAVPDQPGARLWNTTNIAFPGLEAEALLLLLSERGLAASAGAACSSGSLDPSPVLLAMGIPERVAHGSLRFSLSRFTTDHELDDAAAIIADSVERLRHTSPIPT
ncbi:MAG: cysteine desulfurase family protein [Planctomycetota bacterium]